MDEWLGEQLRTVQRLCETALILLEIKREDLLPTILEIILEQVQQIVDNNCIVKKP